MQRSRIRRTGALFVGATVFSLSNGCTAKDTGSRADSAPQQDAVVRAPVPAGVDRRMVEWREDGVLIASTDSLRKTAGYVVDSIFPPDESMRRFRATVPGAVPLRLAGGAPSTEQLLRTFWATLTAGDSVGVDSLSIDKAEFAHLYLPDSPELRSGMQPQIAWLLLDEASVRGLSRARLRAEQLKASTIRGVACSGNPTPVGAARVQGPCGIIVRRPQGLDTVWIANRVISRNGVVKLLGFANPL